MEGFDAAAGAKLYQLLWKPAEEYLANVTRVYLIPDGPLSELAFPALLTEDVSAPIKNLGDIRGLPFLAKAPYAIAVLPDAKSLVDRNAQAAREPYFVGVGNPVVPPCKRETNELLADAASDAIDPGTLGCALKSLPDAGDEVTRVGQQFSEGHKTILQGSNASEANLRLLSERGVLRRASLLLIATHGLAPGELQYFSDPMRLAEADYIGVPTVGAVADAGVRRHVQAPLQELEEIRGALVFNLYGRDVPDTRYTFPPGLVLSTADSDKLDAANDGFLSSPEIAILDIGADLVILSACNTAAQEVAGGSAIFGGLSRSFLAAGAKALILTQWAVVTGAAAEMTILLTQGAASKDARLGPEALHGAMNHILENGGDPHPFVWAPFTFVGPGG